MHARKTLKKPYLASPKEKEKKERILREKLANFLPFLCGKICAQECFSIRFFLFGQTAVRKFFLIVQKEAFPNSFFFSLTLSGCLLFLQTQNCESDFLHPTPPQMFFIPTPPGDGGAAHFLLLPLAETQMLQFTRSLLLLLLLRRSRSRHHHHRRRPRRRRPPRPPPRVIVGPPDPLLKVVRLSLSLSGCVSRSRRDFLWLRSCNVIQCVSNHRTCVILLFVALSDITTPATSLYA